MNDSLCRYWMLVSGAERGALTIAAPLSDMHHGLPAIVVATKGQSVLNDYLLHHADDLQLAQAVRSELLAPDSHVVHTLKSTASTTKGAAGVGGPGRVIVCVGATPRASLYAVYSLMELLGVRYYLHGDVLPSQPNARRLPTLHRCPKRTPLGFLCAAFNHFTTFQWAPTFGSPAIGVYGTTSHRNNKKYRCCTQLRHGRQLWYCWSQHVPVQR